MAGLKTLEEFRELQRVNVNGSEFYFLPIKSGEYKGMYIYLNDPFYTDQNAPKIAVKLRFEHYAAAGFDSVDDAVDALNDYLRFNKYKGD
jgi:hypothetical protein